MKVGCFALGRVPRGGLGVVLGRWVRVVLGLVGLVGCPWWGSVGGIFIWQFCVQGAPSPVDGGIFSWFLIHLVSDMLAFCQNLKRILKKSI